MTYRPKVLKQVSCILFIAMLVFLALILFFARPGLKLSLIIGAVFLIVPVTMYLLAAVSYIRLDSNDVTFRRGFRPAKTKPYRSITSIRRRQYYANHHSDGMRESAVVTFDDHSRLIIGDYAAKDYQRILERLENMSGKKST